MNKVIRFGACEVKVEENASQVSKFFCIGDYSTLVQSHSDQITFVSFVLFASLGACPVPSISPHLPRFAV